MARQAAKRKLIPRPGWVAAARDLSVTYSHLRRVLTGERQGKSLLARYNQWRKDNAKLQASKGRTVKQPFTYRGMKRSLPRMAAQIQRLQTLDRRAHKLSSLHPVRKRQPRTAKQSTAPTTTTKP